MGMTIERDLYIPNYIKDSYKEQINQKPEIYGHESIIICNPQADTNALKKEYKNYLKSISKNVEFDNIGLRKVKFLTVRLDPVIDDRVAEFSDNTNSIKILRGNIISYVDGLKQRVQKSLLMNITTLFLN